jgi:hypothetical protein
MAEETTTTTAEPAKEEAEKTKTADEEVTAQADHPDAVKRALEAERKAARDAAKRAEAAEAKVREFEEQGKSELEKATGKVQSLTNETKDLATENLKLRIALAKSVPAELIDRLQGSTKEELEADADKLLSLVGTSSETSTPGFDPGARQTTSATDMDAAIRRAAGR